MHRIRILPRLAGSSIRKNAAAYLPYIVATSFSVAVFFIFSAIAENPVLRKAPHADYLIVLMQIGKVLLGIILIPFLFYTNSFLMRQRKKELGLYSILGLEKRHIGYIISAETAMVCAASLLLGITTALVFSKLIFLLLLNITRLPVDIAFSASRSCYTVTALFFGCVFLLNLGLNLMQVARANPADLFESGRRGEKQPRHVWPGALLGLAFLGGGYTLGLRFQLDSSFPLVFFAAVLLVIAGTYCLFMAGIILFLRLLKSNRRYYYRKQNFVTISGMLYRMRKSGASLANICIFSTMIMVTLVCTVSLFSGLESIQNYRYPYDASMVFEHLHETDRKAVRDKILSEAQAQNVSVTDLSGFDYLSLRLAQNGNVFSRQTGSGSYFNLQTVRVLRLEEYNRVEKAQERLKSDEVLLFSTRADFDQSSVRIEQKHYRIKKELQTLSFERKEPHAYATTYYLVVADQTQQEALWNAIEGKDGQWLYRVQFNLDGDAQRCNAFIDRLGAQLRQTPGFLSFDNRITGEKEDAVILGGLLFLGVFFGIIFLACMVMIMYYKQLSEGLEDKRNFEVMQQVGMSETEVKDTIRRQIVTVFFLPLLLAVLHTTVALVPVEVLLRTLHLYEHALVVRCAIGVTAAFAVVYSVSYHATAKAYYHIVRR